MRYLRRAAAVAIVGVALAVGAVLAPRIHPHSVWLNRLRTHSHASAVRPLIAAVGQRRFVEPRLAGGFPYAPVASKRGSGDERAAQDLPLLAAAAQVQKMSEDDPTPGNIHSFGVAELLLGRHDAAIEQLEAACSATPVAECYADLSAAYIARAQEQVRAAPLEDLARAVDAAERALDLAPSLDEARFNLALALDGLGLRRDTIGAWNAYLERDKTSGWSHDASTHLEAVRSPARDRSRCLELQSGPPDALIDAASDCPQEARELGETLLSQWARSVTHGRADRSTQALASADRVADLVVSRNGDRLLRDSVDWIRLHPGREMDLAKGHEALDAASALYNSDQRHRAVDDFVRARTLLRSAGSPYWLVAEQGIARLHTHKRELGDASRILEQIGTAADARRYSALQARCAWLYGVVRLQMADPAGALDKYRQAALLYEELGERANLSNVSNAAADTQRVLGDLRRGWFSLFVALTNLPAISDPTRRYLALYDGALYSHLEHLEFAALHFQNEALAVARTRNGPAGVIEGSINKAAILGRLHRLEEALLALNEAVDGVARLDDPQQHAYMSARVAASKGELLMSVNPVESVHQLDAAIRHFSVAEPAEIPRLRLLQGEAYAHGAEEAHAAAAFLEGVKSFESRLRRLREEQDRVAYSDEGWELYQQLVELRVRQGALDEALVVSDRARSRATDDAGEKTSVARLRGLVEPSQRVVFYAVLASESHAWVFGPDSMDHCTIPIGEVQLEQMVSQAERMIGGWRRPAALDALLAKMYASLIAPLNIPEGVREVIIVPDGPLRLVPFASLRDRTGHYLIERWAVAESHSLESLTRALEHQRARHDGTLLKALVVGDPRLDPARSERLPELPFAAREAETVAQLYKNRMLLVGADATRARLLATLPSVDIFHFAGHALANNEFPDLSRLLLTPSGKDSVDLLARDLQTSRLKRGSIVILSACKTGAGLKRRAGGIQSLARAFLTVGASDVVAASWDVDDRDTSLLMTTFHGHLSRGESPAQSLRSAQLRLIAAGRPVSSWAAFVPFTGAVNAR